jgi:predicted amidophosphoribosyltransferase
MYRRTEQENHMTCKGICIRHKAMKPVGSGRYSTGQKRCQVCEIFIKWDGLWCPCCGYRLRTRPRNLKYKAKLRTRKKIDEYRISMQQQEQQQTAVQNPNPIEKVH